MSVSINFVLFLMIYLSLYQIKNEKDDKHGLYFVGIVRALKINSNVCFNLFLMYSLLTFDQ